MENSAKSNPTEGAQRVYNLIILDESGSMISIYEPALSGVNETLQTIRGAKEQFPEQEHFVTLVAFDTGHYNKIYNSTPIELAPDITKDQYRPNGGTPLYDAIGKAVNELRPLVKTGDVVLVTIITDGYENASREYNGQAIKALIDEMKKNDWVFTYIGANQDVEKVAASISISNHINFNADFAGTNAMFEREKRARTNFFGKLHRNHGKDALDREDIQEDYFTDV